MGRATQWFDFLNREMIPAKKERDVIYTHIKIDEDSKRFRREYRKNKTKVAIKKGCPSKECFCTGDCQKIIGWRDKLPDEY